MGARQDLERHAGAQALGDAGEAVAAVVLGLGVEGGADGGRDVEGRGGRRGRAAGGGDGVDGGGRVRGRGVVVGVRAGGGRCGGGDIGPAHDPGLFVSQRAAVGAEVRGLRGLRGGRRAQRVLSLVLDAARPQRDGRRGNDNGRRRSRDGVRVLQITRPGIHGPCTSTEGGAAESTCTAARERARTGTDGELEASRLQTSHAAAAAAAARAISVASQRPLHLCPATCALRRLSTRRACLS